MASRRKVVGADTQTLHRYAIIKARTRPYPGRGQPCPLIWSCSRWGLPSQPVTRLLVGSYIKGPKSPHLFTLTFTVREGGMLSVALSRSFSSWPGRPAASDGGRYPPPCPVEPGL